MSPIYHLHVLRENEAIHSITLGYEAAEREAQEHLRRREDLHAVTIYDNAGKLVAKWVTWRDLNVRN